MKQNTHLLLPLLLAFSCSSSTPESNNGSPVQPQQDDAAGEGNDAGAPDSKLVFDCATIPAKPVSIRTVPGARGYHGLAFTPDGKLLGSDDSSLIAATSQGETSIFTTNIGTGEQMDWLPNGDLALQSSQSQLLGISPTGAQTILHPENNAYSVVSGPDGAIYMTQRDTENRESQIANGAVQRFDPVSGERTIFIPSDSVPANLKAHSIGFSPDNKRLYIGIIHNRSFTPKGDVSTLIPATDGPFFYVDLDDSGNPLGAAQLLAVGVGEGWHDGVATDACGNIYVPDYHTSAVFRISADGAVSGYWDDFPPPPPKPHPHYPHSVTWGTGEHGWLSDALYMAQAYNRNTVVEVVTGVPSSAFTGTVLNAPTPKQDP